jgi:hypothetical protein
MRNLHQRFWACLAVAALAACSGTAGGSAVPAIQAPAYDAAAASAPNLYVANFVGNSVSVYAPGKTSPLRTISKGIAGARALAFDAAQNLYVANFSANTVTVYAPRGTAVIRTISQGVYKPRRSGDRSARKPLRRELCQRNRNRLREGDHFDRAHDIARHQRAGLAGLRYERQPFRSERLCEYGDRICSRRHVGDTYDQEGTLATDFAGLRRHRSLRRKQQRQFRDLVRRRSAAVGAHDRQRRFLALRGFGRRRRTGVRGELCLEYGDGVRIEPVAAADDIEGLGAAGGAAAGRKEQPVRR